MPLAAAAYSETQGHLLAYSVGYDWAQGYRGSLPGQPNPIFIHAVTVRRFAWVSTTSRR